MLLFRLATKYLSHILNQVNDNQNIYRHSKIKKYLPIRQFKKSLMGILKISIK